MAFDFNEARATVEEAKKRGLILNSDSPHTFSKETSKTAPKETGSGVVLPDWLQKEISNPTTSPVNVDGPNPAGADRF